MTRFLPPVYFLLLSIVPWRRLVLCSLCKAESHVVASSIMSHSSSSFSLSSSSSCSCSSLFSSSSSCQVRNWTNGPGFLTWSRGQNSHGNGIAGPLPRSFMKSQWSLQKQILARYRELGIAGHLPAFGGFAPWALAVAQHDDGQGGATRGKFGKDWDTAWIDGRDPLYTRVADAWMKQILTDFGSDHVWQVGHYSVPIPAKCKRTLVRTYYVELSSSSSSFFYFPLCFLLARCFAALYPRHVSEIFRMLLAHL